MMRIAGGPSALVVTMIAALAAGSAQAAAPVLQPLVGAVLRNGPDGKLPANLSLVLGISKAVQGVAVKQATLREGTFVKTFNVSALQHDDVVIMTYDEQSRSMRAYLTSASGVLRKAVAYQPGARAEERPKADAAKDFAAEIKYWTDFSKQPSGH